MTEKCCTSCKQVKPITQFFRRSVKAGFRSRCKPCYAAAQQPRRTWPRHTKPRVQTDGTRASVRKWKQRNPERMRIIRNANNAVRRAIKRGELKRASECQWCGYTLNIQAAHIDYVRPLEIIWLCASCHCRWDTAQPKTADRRVGM